jgi:hypothetical protein
MQVDTEDNYRLFDASSGCGRDELALVRISLTNAVKAYGVFSATARRAGSRPHRITGLAIPRATL